MNFIKPFPSWQQFQNRPDNRGLNVMQVKQKYLSEQYKYYQMIPPTPSFASAAGGNSISPDTGPTFTNTFSLRFDSVDDHVDTNSVKFSGASVFTISCWFNMNSIRTINSLMTNWHSGKTNYILRYNNGVNGFQFYVSTTGTVAALTSYTITPDTDRWYHIAGIYNGSNIALYLNGDQVGTPTSLTGTVLSNTNTDVIAKRDSEFFDGNIDEVAYFTSDQTSNIETIYNGGVPGDLSSLSPVAWYRFEEGSGTTAIDSGTGGSDGTHGATYSTNIPS